MRTLTIGFNLFPFGPQAHSERYFVVVEEELCNETFFPHKSFFCHGFFFNYLIRVFRPIFFWLASVIFLLCIAQGRIKDFFEGGGADFQKNFENFEDLFFSLKGPCFRQIFCAAGKFLKKQVNVSIYWRQRRL